MNAEKDRRWDLLLATNSSNPMVAQEVECIRRNQRPLIDILCDLPPERGFCKDEFLRLYSTLSLTIPDEWFIRPTLSDESFRRFEVIPALANLTAKARHKIWIDVPRTFMAFVSGNNPHATYVELLESPNQTAHLMAVLCRTLSASATFLHGHYCQGMSFLAASYILYCRGFLFDNVKEDEEGLHEAYAAAAYHFIALEHNELADLYVKENALTEYIATFEWQLSSPYTPKQSKTDLLSTSKNIEIHKKLNVLHDHLRLHDMDAHFFVVQWFASCFVLNISAEMLSCLQEIFLYSSGRECTRNLMIRLGVAVLFLLADDMLALDNFESLYMCLKTRMVILTPNDVIPVMFVFDMKDNRSKSTSTSTNTSSRSSNNNDGTCAPPCTVS